MMGEFVTVEFKLLEEKFFFNLFTRKMLCIQYDRDSYACLRNGYVKFKDSSDLEGTEEIMSVSKRFPRIKTFIGKRFLREAISEKKFFYSDKDFIEAYMKEVTYGKEY